MKDDTPTPKMGDSDKLMDVESGQKEAYEEELPSDDDEGGKVIFILFFGLKAEFLGK